MIPDEPFAQVHADAAPAARTQNEKLEVKRRRVNVRVAFYER
ncbi:hypothetical protein P0D88_36390 [Paraburkholderia sp. RL18-103-BIB-C]|jgi:hypothetical protein